MRRQLKQPETQQGWWRFDRYEIQDAVIRPAPGSRLRWYDPWVDFQQTRNQTNGQPAYIELTLLASVLRADPATKGRLTNLSADTRSQILAWCNRHGLLGILLGRWESIALSPQPTGGDPRLRKQIHYTRGYGTTVCGYETAGNFPEARSSVLIHALDDLKMKEELLGKTWCRFLPSVRMWERETFAYPDPYSPAFWELYAEPLVEFCQAVALLANCVEHLGPPEKSRTRAALASESPILARAQAVGTLNLLRRNVSQVLIDENDELRQQWVSPSLLASFAEMFVQDVVAGARAQYCECCRKLFLTRAYQAVYCGDGCRMRQQKRNLRAKMEQARSLYSKGRTVREISRTLNENTESIQRWVTGFKRGRKAGRS